MSAGGSKTQPYARDGKWWGGEQINKIAMDRLCTKHKSLAMLSDSCQFNNLEFGRIVSINCKWTGIGKFDMKNLDAVNADPPYAHKSD